MDKKDILIPILATLVGAIIGLCIMCGPAEAQEMWMDVDAAVTVPVNIYPLTDSDGVIDAGVTYNEAGLDMVWNFVLPDGTQTQTAFDPCDTGGDYDWTAIGDGMYKIGIPDTGGADMDNDTEGFGWVTGTTTATLPFRGPIIGFRSSLTNDSLIEGLLLNVQDIADGIDAGSADMNTVVVNTNLYNTDAEYADAIWKALLTGATYNIATSAGKRLRQAGQDATLIREQTCQAGGDSTNVIIDSGASGSNNFYDHMDIILTDGTGAGQVATMHDYVGGTFTADVYPVWVTTPDASTTYAIISKGSTHVHEFENNALVQINAEVDTALNTAIPGGPMVDSINQRMVAVDDLIQAAGAGDLAAMLLDTIELQTDWVNGGRLDNLLDTASVGGAVYPVNSTVAAAVSTTIFTLAAGVTNNDAYNNNIIAVYDLTDTHWEVRAITDYVGATRTITVGVAFSFIPAPGDTVHIIESAYIAGGGGGGWW